MNRNLFGKNWIFHFTIWKYQKYLFFTNRNTSQYSDLDLTTETKYFSPGETNCNASGPEQKTNLLTKRISSQNHIPDSNCFFNIHKKKIQETKRPDMWWRHYQQNINDGKNPHISSTFLSLSKSINKKNTTAFP